MVRCNGGVKCYYACLGELIWEAVGLKDRVVYACSSQIVEPLESHVEIFPSFSR